MALLVINISTRFFLLIMNNLYWINVQDVPPDLTAEEEEIVEEYMDIIYDLINTRINSIDDGLEPDLSLNVDPPPNGDVLILYL